ncbi:MAG: hypothetical protein VB035_02065 [Candidatus Fimivivens sp.]|nr:hypothetical protein [Candidatus Fimivivens sp.]
MITLQRLIALFLCVFLLFGCSGRSISESGSSEASTKKPELAVEIATSPVVELRTPQVLYVYRFFSKGRMYEKKEITFMDEPTLLSVINRTTEACGFEEPLPIISVKESNFVHFVIDFDKSLLDRVSEREMYELFSTLVMTLQQNLRSSGPIQFTLEGDVEAFGGSYDPAPLVLAEGDPAEFAAICASIPYEGLQTEPPYVTDELAELTKPIDATMGEITEFLSILGQIEKDAASPAELDQERLVMSCILATAHYWSIPYESEPTQYRKELAPIADSVSTKLGITEDMFWIADHVRQTARLLCGDDFTLQLTQKNCDPWSYFEQEGVITPPHMGGGYALLPVVLNYKATADGYRVEAVYIYDSMDGFSLWGGDNIPEAQLADFVQHKAPRREIILKRADDGKLRFVSHRFL